MEIKAFSLDLINKWRNTLFGIATLLVICVHLELSTVPDWIAKCQRFGQLGVDIFLFLSGAGCYLSLEKHSVAKFYQNRLLRILPIYLFVFIAYGCFCVRIWDYDIQSYFQEYSIAAFPLYGITRHWYIFACLTLYLISPILYTIINFNKGLYWGIFIGIIIGVAQIYFMDVPDNVYNINELFLCRIPIYMLGFYFGQIKSIPVDSEFIIFRRIAMITLAYALLINKTNVMGILHICSILIAPYIIYYCICLFEHCKIFAKVFSKLGVYSLGIYLWQEKLFKICYCHTAWQLWIQNIVSIVGALLLTSIFIVRQKKPKKHSK